MSLSIRLSDDEAKLIKTFASMHNITVSELVRRSVLEKIEDEYDIRAYEAAMKEFEKDPTTWTLDEVEKELGLR